MLHMLHLRLSGNFINDLIIIVKKDLSLSQNVSKVELSLESFLVIRDVLISTLY